MFKQHDLDVAVKKQMHTLNEQIVIINCPLDLYVTLLTNLSCR